MATVAPVLAPAPPADEPAPAPLRIALFSGNYNCVADGANQALNRLVAHAEARGHARFRTYSPVVAMPAFPPAGELVGVPSIAIPGRAEYRLALGLPAPVRRDIMAFAPDVVHLSAPDLLGSQAMRLARRLGISVVTSLHTRFEKYLRHYGLGFLARPVERRLLRFYGDSDHVLVPNAAIAAELSAAGIASPISLWSRGVDPQRFGPALRDREWRQSLGYADGDVAILFFGRIVREKGIAVFADVIDRLRARGHRLRPLIVGDGPARPWLARRLANANFTGHLSGTALGRAVASADILFNPSLTEAFGNVVLEAMASGLPVVSPDADSARSLLVHDRTGLLVAPSLDACADALESLIVDPDRRARMGEAALRESSRFKWETTLDAVLDIYARHAPAHDADA